MFLVAQFDKVLRELLFVVQGLVASENEGKSSLLPSLDPRESEDVALRWVYHLVEIHVNASLVTVHYGYRSDVSNKLRLNIDEDLSVRQIRQPSIIESELDLNQGGLV